VKKFQLLILLLFFLPAVKAQEKLQLKQNEFLKDLLNQKRLNPNKSPLDQKEIVMLNESFKEKFIYENKNFKVYALPLDNMGCLSSKRISNMPIDKSAPELYIPNPLYKKK
jgi:hypothetical protein